MQIPMEALSLLTLRTGPGEYTRPRAPAYKDDFLFGQFMDAARVGSEPFKPKETAEPKSPGTMPEGKKAFPFTAEKRSKLEDITDAICDEEMSLAAGVIMGNQNKVVFILEGDMESGTDPVLSIAAAGGGAAEIVYLPEEAEPDTPLFILDETDVITGTGHADSEIAGAVKAAITNEAAGAADTADSAGAAGEALPVAADAPDNTAEKTGVIDEPAVQSYAGSEAVSDTELKTAAADTAQDGSAAIEDTGEVTARMPAIRTSERSERQDGDDEDPASYKDGYLSPLENENDKTQVKGRKDKEYSKAENTANDTVKSTEVPGGNAGAPVAADIKPERFQADQQMSRAAGEPVGTENLFDKMVSQIETNLMDDVRTMTIQLKPEFLGKVAIELALDAAGLHVKINADDLGVKSIVNSQINSLVETLQNKGIEVVEVEVAYTGIDNGEFTDPRKNGAQQPDNPKRARRQDADAIPDDVTYYAMTPVEMMEYYVDAGVSSVEYRA